MSETYLPGDTRQRIQDLIKRQHHYAVRACRDHRPPALALVKHPCPPAEQGVYFSCDTMQRALIV